MTTILANQLVQHKLKQRFARVVDFNDITPTIRRVRLAGPDLADLPYSETAPDAHVKLFFPETPNDPIETLRMPNVLPDGEADWYGVRDGRFSAFRDYTIRQYSPENQWIDIDFVLHEGGVGGPWAMQVQVGHYLGIFGPRILKNIPLNAQQYLLFADETALPAVMRWLEVLPSTAQVWAAVEVSQQTISLPELEHPNLALHLGRRKLEDNYGDWLIDALSKLPQLEPSCWCWGGCEANTVVALKRALRATHLDPNHLDLKAYWKRNSE